MWHLWGRSDMPRGFWWEHLRENDYMKDLGLYGRKIKWLLVTQKNA